jgi:dTDP-4-amino-4,6-dideoxygalactose transaminase
VSAAPPRIPLSVPHLGGNEARYLEECVRTNYVSPVGPFVDRFEREFAAFVQAPHAVACSSGTAALHLAMRLLGVGPGDEVFVSTLTFVASVNAVLYERAIPVLVDSERATWNMDGRLAAAEIEARARDGRRQPKAVQVVHVLGQPADMDLLGTTCARHGIALVEDAAEALGARYLGGRFAGRQVGTIGRLGCFSFNGNKVITSGGGGMVVTEDAALARRGRHLVRQARMPGPEYVHDEVGYNYGLTNVAAALGLAQLEQLPRFLERKRAIAEAYDRALGDVPGLTLPPQTSWATSSRWLYSVLIDPAAFGADRHLVREQLLHRGIETRPLWSPAHGMEPYRDLPRLGGAVAEEIHARGLSLPSSVGLTDEDQAFVIESLMLASGR